LGCKRRSHRHASRRQDSSCEDRESRLVEARTGTCDGNGWASPTCIGINQPQRAEEKCASGHTGAERDASLRKRTGCYRVVHAPADIVRYADQKAEKHVKGGTEEIVSSRVGPKLPQVGLDLGAPSLAKRWWHPPRVEPCPRAHALDREEHHERVHAGTGRRAARFRTCVAAV
jgi:hypothetical protein